MKIKITIAENKRVDSIERTDKPSWVDKIPILSLPDFLIPLVNIHSEGTQSREGKGGWRKYINGQPINKDMVVIYPSGQQWQLLRNDQKAELLELVEWLGGDADEFVRNMEDMLPRDPERKH